MAEHFYVLLFNVCAFCTEKINYSYLFNFCLAFCSIRNCYTFSIIIMYFINKTVLPLYDYGRTEWIIQRPLYNKEKKTILTLKSVIIFAFFPTILVCLKVVPWSQAVLLACCATKDKHGFGERFVRIKINLIPRSTFYCFANEWNIYTITSYFCGFYVTKLCTKINRKKRFNLFLKRMIFSLKLPCTVICVGAVITHCNLTT